MTPPGNRSGRRRFLGKAALATAALATSSRATPTPAPDPGPLFRAIGIGAPPARAAELAQAGIQFLTVGVGEWLVPDKPDAEFEPQAAKLRDCPLPILACNGFLPGDRMRCVGPKANHDAIVAWAETTFRRGARIGAKFIVFGSGGARKRPADWPVTKADDQFVSLLERLGPAAAAAGITVAVEQLQASECNYLNHIAEAAAVVRRADHPRVRLLADLFHMARSGDTPADLQAACDVLAHVEIAERRERTPPGVDGDDFRPFFRVLHAAGYRGAINIEGRWEIGQIATAVAEIRRQAQL